jgi:threonylcarbamoyladenosine tRNA methylthiotransferase MtaB
MNERANVQDVEVVTFGCRLNISESEAIRRHAEAAGHRNLIVVNTCAVTAEATRQARQSIRRLKRERPDAKIVVTGCAAQIEPENFAAMPDVALVLGNDEKLRPVTWADLAASNSFGVPDIGLSASEKVKVADIMAVRETAVHMADAFEAHTRAFVQVQNGCDHRCTFCVIPFGRGNSRSVPVNSVVEQVKRLCGQGTREVVLTGVDMTSYGKDMATSPGLGQLVQAVLRHVPQLPRLRLSSIDAVEIDDALRDALASEQRLMPHLHLSLQSGDDLILKRMKRRHTRNDAIRFCAEMRALRPDIVFGADVIAGFPTEDEAMFLRSLDMVEACGITYLHVFPYSPRPGTPAARMPQLAGAVIAGRAARLRAVGDAAHAAHLISHVGRTLRVLTERGNSGRTEGFAAVRFAGSVTPGQLLNASIVAVDGKRLIAVPEVPQPWIIPYRDGFHLGER